MKISRLEIAQHLSKIALGVASLAVSRKSKRGATNPWLMKASDLGKVTVEPEPDTETTSPGACEACKLGE